MTTTIQTVDLIQAVPHYPVLKRQHGRLMKDFGLLKHQRKAVYDLVATFMHANSHQNYLRETSPSVHRTHKDDLRKSQELEFHTIEQVSSTCSSPLASTDSESDDDTIYTPPNTPPPQTPIAHNIYLKQEYIDELNHRLDTLVRPTKGAYCKLLEGRRSKRGLGKKRISQGVYEKEKYDREYDDYADEKYQITEDLIQAKREIGDLKRKLGNVDEAPSSVSEVPRTPIAKSAEVISQVEVAKTISEPKPVVKIKSLPARETLPIPAPKPDPNKMTKEKADLMIDKVCKRALFDHALRNFTLAEEMGKHSTFEDFIDDLSVHKFTVWKNAFKALTGKFITSTNRMEAMKKYDEKYIFARYKK